MTRISLAFLIALAGCSGDDPRSCNGGPGLHVRVDLSGPRCEHLTTWSVQVSVGATTLDPSTDTYQRESFDGGRHLDYVWSWPASALERQDLRVDFWGTGEAQTAGAGSVTDSVHPSECMQIDVPVKCTGAGPDAQL